MYAELEAGINFPHYCALSSLGMNNMDSHYKNKRFICLKKGMLKDIFHYMRNFKLSESDYKYIILDLLPELSRKLKLTR